jgi:hypothetical protein
MSFVENVLKECKQMESVLREHLGASGYGLGQMTRSVGDALDGNLIRRLKIIARTRNRLVHEADYSHEETDQPDFLRECQSVNSRLRALVSDSPADDESDAASDADEELDQMREDAITSIGDTLENIEAHRELLAAISGALEDGYLVVMNATDQNLDVQVESELLDAEDTPLKIKFEPTGIAYIPDDSTITIKNKYKGRTKVELSQFSVDSETCLFYSLVVGEDGLTSVEPDPSLLERIMNSFTQN